MVSHRRTGNDSRSVKLLLFVRFVVAASSSMQVHDQLVGMDAQQLREFAAGLIERVTRQGSGAALQAAQDRSAHP